MIGDMESTLLIDAAYRANFDLPADSRTGWFLCVKSEIVIRI